MSDDDINVLALIKGKERYIFIYDDEQRGDVPLKFGQFVAHPGLSFTKYDAAALVRKMEQTERQRTADHGTI